MSKYTEGNGNSILRGNMERRNTGIGLKWKVSIQTHKF